MSDMSNRAAAAASQCGECGDRFRAEIRALRDRTEKAEARADALAKALAGLLDAEDEFTSRNGEHLVCVWCGADFMGGESHGDKCPAAPARSALAKYRGQMPGEGR